MKQTLDWIQHGSLFVVLVCLLGVGIIHGIRLSGIEKRLSALESHNKHQAIVSETVFYREDLKKLHPVLEYAFYVCDDCPCIPIDFEGHNVISTGTGKAQFACAGNLFQGIWDE